MNNKLGNMKPLFDSIVNTGGAQHIVIAGGFLRDIHLGRKPKDIDVFFSGTPSSQTIFKRLRDNLPEFFNGCTTEFFTDEGYGKVDGFEFGVYDVMKVKLKSGLQMDIIATRDVWEHPCELLAKNFDCNINALVYTKDGLLAPNGYPMDSNNFICYPLGGVYNGNPMTFDRMKHLIEKAPYAQWDSFQQFFSIEQWEQIKAHQHGLIKKDKEEKKAEAIGWAVMEHGIANPFDEL